MLRDLADQQTRVLYWLPVVSLSLRFNVRIASKRLLTSRMIAAITIIAPNSFFSGTIRKFD